jgi:uroporphyrin-3 C-methyltransferase
LTGQQPQAALYETAPHETIAMSDIVTINTAQPARRPWLALFALLLIFLLFAASAAGSYWLWTQLQKNTAQQTEILQQLQQQQQHTETLQQKLDTEISSNGRFRKQTQETLKDSSEKLRNLDRIDTSYWRLAEAEFLIKQAHQRLFITHDAETADLLLASADAAIMQQKDPSLLQVRSAIATDRAALRKVPRVDRDGVYLRLQTLSSQVGMLTSDNRFLQQTDANTSAENTNSSYSEQLWQRLSTIVRIRHHDQLVEPLLPPEQEVYLHQNLQLVLVQAQLGLMQSQQQTYVSNLERAAAWVNQYCQTEDPFVRGWLEETQTLIRTNIAPDLPDISGSVRSVQKVIEQRIENIQRALSLDDDEQAGDPETATPSSEAAQ